MLNIYWKFMCCDSRVPIDECDPSTAGEGMNSDFERFGEWVHNMKWRNWDGCPYCDASEPLIESRTFVIR